MKTLIILTAFVLLSCTQEAQEMNCLSTGDNWGKIQGYWENPVDYSSLEVHNNVMYLHTDTFMHLFSWSITDKVFTIWTYDEPVQITYKFNLILLNDTCLILQNDKEHYYKLRLKF